MSQAKSFSITPKGVVYVEVNMLATTKERPYPTHKAFDRAWKAFEAWLPSAHPELVGKEIPSSDFSKFVGWFREWEKTQP